MKKELLLRASRDGISVSEVIRQALRSYVEAS
ncbi:MAG: ribbon-helix-helix protein, CopG family [Actinobacteria bacterium]|nr:ribbon-helix-helix protein, CopG family [Actinomycetota bacterium]